MIFSETAWHTKIMPTTGLENMDLITSNIFYVIDSLLW